MVRQTLGRVARYGAPRTLAALQDMGRVSGQVDQLTDRLHELERRLAAGDGEREEARLRAAAVESELRDQVRRLEHELAESRRLALRVGQLTDLVFSRLAGVTAPPQAAAAPTGQVPSPRRTHTSAGPERRAARTRRADVPTA